MNNNGYLFYTWGSQHIYRHGSSDDYDNSNVITREEFLLLATQHPCLEKIFNLVEMVQKTHVSLECQLDAESTEPQEGKLPKGTIYIRCNSVDINIWPPIEMWTYQNITMEGPHYRMINWLMKLITDIGLALME